MKSYNGFTPKQRLAGDKIIKKAIEDGILMKLSDCKCKFCGQDKGIRHYHCEDYSPENILNDAIPVCWLCHMMIHSRFKHPKSYVKYFREIKKGKRYSPTYRGNDWDKLESFFID